MKDAKKLKYRVKPHNTFGPEHQHKEGQTVELTAEEAQPFLDKLELVGKGVSSLPAGEPGLKNDLDMQAETLLPPAELSVPAEDEIVVDDPDAKPPAGKKKRKTGES